MYVNWCHLDLNDYIIWMHVIPMSSLMILLVCDIDNTMYNDLWFLCTICIVQFWWACCRKCKLRTYYGRSFLPIESFGMGDWPCAHNFDLKKKDVCLNNGYVWSVIVDDQYWDVFIIMMPSMFPFSFLFTHPPTPQKYTWRNKEL